MKIYVASSWKNTFYPGVVFALRDRGHEVWDWRNPPTGGNGFSWKEADGDGGEINTPDLNRLLQHPAAQTGFRSDLQGMHWAVAAILLLPSGRSAHMEAGWLQGSGKPVYVLRPMPEGPDLMHLLFRGIWETLPDLCAVMERDYDADL